ncbi:deaminase [Arthrobacter sp. UCD-GKA]|uniref:dihydrofolate reductase family protein n=1 Tax=Arthrobacter sp. UCD-GKA TaxID=1913576 RepID=UPI0008DE90F4|nr:dihydrofolate reductase family protein [Arthrobacter sp. UCD-GKA]OIH84169.1 deaminase [Arthrobacter sp. UCD-GKA]
MSRVRVHNFSVSIDGYGAGINQGIDDPLGVRGEELHGWVFSTACWHERSGEPGGSTGTDDAWLRAGDTGIGATVMGRNMFGPIRGPWDADDEAASWRGWWGESPPYGHDVFVLTHHPRHPLPMSGGTTFHFVADGLPAALEAARSAAHGADIRLGGGVATVREAVAAGLVDELHLAFAPVLLGAGERLFTGNWVADGYRVAESQQGEGAFHVRLLRA